jgi:hypothetical protein
MGKINRTYIVINYKEQGWAVIRANDDQCRPVGERLYTQRTHAYRRCRKLNADVAKLNAIIKRDGALIL